MKYKHKVFLRKLLFIPMRSFSLEFDRDYGMHKRTGWTVVMDGCVCSELERNILISLRKAYIRRWAWEDECICRKGAENE